MFFHKDPRRIQPLVDFIVDSFMHLDFNTELSFDAVKVIAPFRAFFEELGRKFMPWVDQTVERSWAEIHGEHDDVYFSFFVPSPCLLAICVPHQVRAFISEILAFSHNIKVCQALGFFTRVKLESFLQQWRPHPSIPTAEVFVRECQKLPPDFDIMNMRGTYHKARIEDLVQRLKDWRVSRTPGVRAFQSTYDR